jgi:serine/threonine protein kinase
VTASDFTLGKLIGKGGYGDVFLAKDRSGSQFAIKRLFSETLKGRRIRRYLSEVRTLATCNSRFLVRFKGFTVEPPYLIVTEFLPNGSLDKYIRGRPNCVCRLTGTQRTIIAMGIALGMAHMHRHGIMHRDLKPGNILLDDHFLPRICDFGLARFDDSSPMTRKIGTPSFMAPEQLMSNDYGNKVDVYAFGLLLYEMSELRRPYQGLNLHEIFREVVMQKWRPEFSSVTPGPLKELIRNCWADTPESRPTFDDIYSDFVSGAVAFPGSDAAEIERFWQDVERQGESPARDKSPVQTEEDYEEETTSFLAEERQVPLFPELDARFPSDFRSPRFRQRVENACATINPGEIRSLLAVLATAFRPNQDRPLQSFLLTQFAVLLGRGTAFIRAFVNDPFFSSGRMEVKALSSQWLALYEMIFKVCPELIDDRHQESLRDLFEVRTERMLILFSHFVSRINEVENPWPILELLYEIPRKVRDFSHGRLLLSLFAVLLKTLKTCPKERTQAIFLDFLRSRDPETVSAAYGGILALEIPFSDLSILNQHLRDSVLWVSAVRFLARRGLSLDEELIEGLCFRACESRLAVYVLLRAAKTREMARFIALHREWMFAGASWPLDVFRLLLAVIGHSQKRIAADPCFAHVLLAATVAGDGAVLTALLTVFRITGVTLQQLNSLSQVGFFEIYREKCVQSQSFDALYRLLDLIAEVGFVDEMRDMLQALLLNMKQETVHQYLSLVAKLVIYRPCVELLQAIHFFQYCAMLKRYDDYSVIADKVLQGH